MRALLAVLRDNAGFAPAPGLTDIGELVAGAATAGVRVESTFRGRKPMLPAGLELAAYRVVQEAVTNVIKHSGADSCQVDVDYHSDRLCLTVVDHGRGGAAATGTPEGHGLVGMRERVTMYGGHLDAGPLSGGGFRIAAVFPLASTENPET